MKRKLYSIILLSVWAGIAIGAEVDLRRVSENLLFDGTFSDPLNITWGSSAVAGAIENGAMCLTSADVSCNMAQSLLVPDGRYRLEFRVRTRDLDGTRRIFLKVRKDNRDLAVIDIPGNGDSEWQTYRKEFSVNGKDKLNLISVVMSMEPMAGKTQGKTVGRAWFDDIRLEPLLSPEEIATLPSLVISGITGSGRAGLYTPGQPVEFNVAVRNLSSAELSSELKYEIRDYYGTTLVRQNIPIKVKENAVETLKITIPPPAKLGFYSVNFQLGGNNGNNNRNFISAERSFLILESMAGKNDPFWGLAMQRTGIVLAPAYELIGIGRIIMPFHWTCESQPGIYNWGEADRFIAAYNRHGIQVIGAVYEFFMKGLPGWESERIRQLAKDSGNPPMPDAEHYRRYADFVRALVTRYHDRITVWDIFNEIDGMAASGNETPINDYVEKVRTFSRAAKSADPAARIVTLEATSSDAGQGYPVLKRLWSRLKDDVDAIWPHPYPVPRMLGPGKRVQNPEDNIRQYLTAAAEIGAPEGKNTLGISEIGYTIDRSLPLDSPEHRKMAELTARMMILARSVPGMEYVGYFLAIETPSDDSIHTYGLWENIYNDGNYFNPTADTVYPRPVLAAYATTARFLNRVIYCKPLKTDRNVYAFYFQKERGGVIALWGLGDGGNPIKMNLALPYAVTVYDIMGNPTEMAAGEQHISLTSSPLFLAVPENENGENRMSASLEQARTLQPQVAAAVRLRTSDELAVKIRNQTRRQLPISVILGDSKNPAQQLTLPPQATVDTTFRLPSADVLSPKEGRIVVTASGVSYDFPFRLELQPVHRATGTIRIDGDLKKYHAFPPVLLDLLTPPDAKSWGTWTGENDCSARAWFLWDEEFLYLAVEVTDDIHIQNETPRQMWKQDNLMLAVDAGNNAFQPTVSGSSGYDGDDSEFVFGLDNNNREKTYLWKNPFHVTGEKIPGVVFKTVRDGSLTCYEVAIPWKTLTSEPISAGRVMGMNAVVSDCDEGTMRQYWRGISLGIHTAKDPSLYKPFILLP